MPRPPTPPIRWRGFATGFRLPPGVIYLDGNSLGLAPHAALSEIAVTAEREWAQGLIGSWNAAGWFDLPTRYGDLIAGLIGAGKARSWSATPPRSTSTRRCMPG